MRSDTALELYGVLGARYFYTGASLTLAHPLVGFQPSASRDKDWIDPVIGFVGRYRIDPKWFINSEADIGGLSDSATGQALAAVGYYWTSNLATTLGYRVLYGYERQDSGGNRSFRYQQWMYGPYIGLNYAF